MAGDVEEIRNEFVCKLCLDLVYKPAVLQCGHFFCLDCALPLLSLARINDCPVCRAIIGHVPFTCYAISFLTEFIYPKTYIRREIEFGDKGPEDLDIGAGMELTDEWDILEHIFSILRCSLCENPLILPIVTTCGHVYCEYCIRSCMENDSFDCIRCNTHHYNWNPVVCYGLNTFIAELFPCHSEIKKLQLVKFTFKQPTAQWWSDIILVHRERSCFKCWMHPIIGDCYSCDVCDLNCCSKCFITFGSGVMCFPNHTDEHEISIYPPISVRDRILAEAAISPEDNSPIRRKSKVHALRLNPDQYAFTFEGIPLSEEHCNIIKFVTIT